MATSTSVPAVTSPSTTPVVQPASVGQRTLGAHQAVGGDVEGPFAGRRQPRRIGGALHGTHAEARLRAARTPRGLPIIMRTTMPSGVSV